MPQPPPSPFSHPPTAAALINCAVSDPAYDAHLVQQWAARRATEMDERVAARVAAHPNPFDDVRRLVKQQGDEFAARWTAKCDARVAAIPPRREPTKPDADKGKQEAPSKPGSGGRPLPVPPTK